MTNSYLFIYSFIHSFMILEQKTWWQIQYLKLSTNCKISIEERLCVCLTATLDSEERVLGRPNKTFFV